MTKLSLRIRVLEDKNNILCDIVVASIDMRMSYAEGLTSPEIEIAEGGTMLDNKSKYADLRMMLDSNREGIKMDAMKRIINMVARGKDVSELFPSVVKNVAVKNLEVRMHPIENFFKT